MMFITFSSLVQLDNSKRKMKGAREVQQLKANVQTPKIQKSCRRTGAILVQMGDQTMWFDPRHDNQTDSPRTPKSIPPKQKMSNAPRQSSAKKNTAQPKAAKERAPRNDTPIPNQKQRNAPEPSAPIRSQAELAAQKLTKHLTVKTTNLSNSQIKAIQQNLKKNPTHQETGLTEQDIADYVETTLDQLMKKYIDLAVQKYFDDIFSKDLPVTTALASDDDIVLSTSSDEDLRLAIELSRHDNRILQRRLEREIGEPSNMAGMVGRMANLNIGKQN